MHSTQQDYSFDQIAQLVASLRKNGWSKDDITKLGQAGNQRSADVRNVLTGTAEVVVKVHVIDLDADPLIPYEGWQVVEHQKGGKIEWSPEKVNLYLSPNQQNGKTIQGHKLWEELQPKIPFNANLLDYIADHPHLFPEEWKVDEQGRTRYIYCHGTKYRDTDGSLYVRCFCWGGGHVQANYYFLGVHWDDQDPAAVPAN